MVTTPKSWTKPEDEVLTKLWLEGIDARLIASHKTLAKNGRTRMSVISRAHRLKLPPHSAQRVLPETKRQVEGRPKPAQPRPTAREKIEQAIDLFPVIEAETEADEPAMGAVAAILALRNNQCRFPIGDVRLPDFHFCGKQKIPGDSYCAECGAKAYDRKAPQRRKDPSIEPLVTKEKTLA